MRRLKEIEEILAERKEVIRKKYGVRIAGIFGSFARSENTETSDVDILVELERPIGLKFFELWDELENVLAIKVELLTVKAVKQNLKLWESIKEDLVYV